MSSRRVLLALLFGGALSFSALLPARSADAGAPVAESRDARADGAAVVDDAGAPEVDERLRELFDYYLSAWGEQSLPAIRHGLSIDLARRMPSSALARALGLFDRYVTYQQMLSAQSGPVTAETPASLARQVDEVYRLRARYFSVAEARGLFNLADEMDHLVLARQSILADPALDARARRDKINALEAALPASLRAMRQETLKPLELARAERLLRAQGAEDGQVFLLRQRQVGTAAALRLQALDAEQEVWRQRIDSFRAARQTILNEAGLSPAARRGELAALREKLFTPGERLRLPAYAPDDD